MHFPVLLWLMIVVVDVICAVFCGSIAARKGYSPMLFDRSSASSSFLLH